MLYLLDANVLITASNLYYPLDAVPEFWDWLVHHASIGNIKVPIEIFEEIKDGGTDTRKKDLLYAWIQEQKDLLVLDQEVDSELVKRVVEQGYARDLTDDELEQLGRDPFLIAHGLASPNDRFIVTTEVSAPKKTRQNRRIPDVCRALGVSCVDTFAMLRALEFSTGWHRSVAPR